MSLIVAKAQVDRSSVSDDRVASWSATLVLLACLETPRAFSRGRPSTPSASARPVEGVSAKGSTMITLVSLAYLLATDRARPVLPLHAGDPRGGIRGVG